MYNKSCCKNQPHPQEILALLFQLQASLENLLTAKQSYYFAVTCYCCCTGDIEIGDITFSSALEAEKEFHIVLPVL